jgi:hypothetical protein
MRNAHEPVVVRYTAPPSLSGFVYTRTSDGSAALQFRPQHGQGPIKSQQRVPGGQDPIIGP